MGGATAIININAVGLVENGNNLSAKAAQNHRRNLAISAVGAVHDHLQALQISISSAQNMLNIELC